jgi:hypothetical protein
MDWYLQYWPYLVAYHIFGLFWYVAPFLARHYHHQYQHQ